MNKIAKFFDNNWTVTLVSTMFGIIIGLYVTSYFEKKSLLRAKENALEQVATELSDNKILLESYHEVLDEKYQALSYLFGTMSQNMELITHLDSLNSFKTQTKSIFDFSTYESLANQQIKVRGDLNLHIESKLIARGLSHIVWDSYKQTNYMSVTKFDCLTDVEAIYNLQNEVNRLNTEWKAIFFRGPAVVDPVNRTDFMNLWDQLLLRQEMLLKFYSFKDEVLKNCN